MSRSVEVSTSESAKQTYVHMLPDFKLIRRTSKHPYTHVAVARTSDRDTWGHVGWSRSEANAQKYLDQFRRNNPSLAIEGQVEPINGGSRLIGYMCPFCGDMVRDLKDPCKCKKEDRP